MKEIERKEQRKILIDILKYFDNICRKNNLNYSLTGGSLIGAIRHKGIIPWDDDIDVVLLSSDYDKLLNILKNEKNDIYEVQYFGCNETYFYPFIKIIDKRTKLIEKDKRDIENYGIYLDVFSFNKVPNNELARKMHYKKILFYKKLINLYSYNQDYIKNEKNFIKRCGSFLCSKIGFRFLNNRYIYNLTKYNKKENYEFYMSNWPFYGFDKEIFNKECFNKFVDCDFEDMKAMISASYDNILKTLYNDYMKLPPVEKRTTTHNIDVYWK